MTTSDFPWDLVYPYLSNNRTVCRGVLGPVVATQGSGPYTEDAFDLFLTDCSIQPVAISAECPTNVFVIGREDWNVDDVDELRGRFWVDDIRVYSQEMVVASMAIGADIFDFDQEGGTISLFVRGHPALEYFYRDEPADSGRPPSRDTREELVETLRVAFDFDSERPTVGILGDMGYRVGKVKGLPRHQRVEILWRTFRVQLTATSPWTKEYISEWGQRCSSTRLNKMCNVLRRLIKTAERKRAVDMSVAIAEWEEDLQFLLENQREWLTHTH